MNIDVNVDRDQKRRKANCKGRDVKPKTELSVDCGADRVGESEEELVQSSFLPKFAKDALQASRQEVPQHFTVESRVTHDLEVPDQLGERDFTSPSNVPVGP